MKRFFMGFLLVSIMAAQAQAMAVIIDVRSERGVQRDVQGNYYSYPGEKIVRREIKHTCGTNSPCRTYIVEERQLKWNGHWINP